MPFAFHWRMLMASGREDGREEGGETKPVEGGEEKTEEEGRARDGAG
jgi:hypothetical protein